jgi:hypothetical protein
MFRGRATSSVAAAIEDEDDNVPAFMRPAAPAPRRAPQQQQQQEYDDPSYASSGAWSVYNDNDDDNNDMPLARPRSAPRNRGQKREATAMVQVLERAPPSPPPPPDEDNDGPAEGGMVVNVAQAGRRIGRDAIIVPYAVTRAAERIMEALSSATALRAIFPNAEVKRRLHSQLSLLIGHPDEFTVPDPLVLVMATVNTGTCRVALREAVPVSRFLLARALNGRYDVVFSRTAKTAPQPFDECRCKPFHDQLVDDEYQPFGIETLVAQALDEREDDTDAQVRAHFDNVGPLSSAEACDAEWQETHLERVRAILSGAYRPLVPLDELRQTRRRPAISALDFQDGRQTVGDQGLVPRSDTERQQSAQLHQHRH